MHSKFLRSRALLLILFCAVVSSPLWAQTPVFDRTRIQDTGVSGLWILANVSFAGMRAQNHRDVFWRIVSFILGLPGTLLTFLVVKEGSHRAYGVDLPGLPRA